MTDFSANDTLLTRYQRAQAFMQGFTTQSLVQNDTLFPVWIGDTDCFWYKRATREPSGDLTIEYRLVDAKAATNQAAFDNGVLAETLAKASEQPVDPHNLPISHITINLNPLSVRFNAFEQRWHFNSEQCVCETIPSTILPLNETLSHDGKQVAFIRDHNIWVRELESGKERALTEDGTDDYGYYAATGVWGTAINRRKTTPAALWSPDGTRLLTAMRDTRQVKTLPMIDYVPQDGSIRPQLTQTKVAYPGDEHIETWQPISVDVATGKMCKAKYDPIPAGYSDYLNFFNNLLWWAGDSQHAYFLDQERGDRSVRLVKWDITSGATHIVFEEVLDPHVNIIPDTDTLPLHRFLPDTNELIWWSERSGWGHLYLYDLTTGQLKRAITVGDWRVRDVVYIDKTRRELWLQTSGRVQGRNPYYRDICRVNIDTGEIITLISGDEEWMIHHPSSKFARITNRQMDASQQINGVANNGDCLIATKSRVDQASQTVLIDRQGKQLLALETTDTSNLPSGWQWPEPVKLLAADGETDLYGVLYRPSDFSPDQRYPVLNYIHGAPWLSSVPKGSFHMAAYTDAHYFHCAALAELGFVVVIIDGCGTEGRSKAFRDKSCGWIPSAANKEDHIGALKQLATCYPFMDMDRVGVVGSAYRSALQQFLECQNFYKVCVMLSLLDNRLTGAFEGDRWEGVDGPAANQRYPEQLADKLQSPLLLMHAITSYLSPSYPPAAVFRVVDALQKANKNFDMLVVPQGGFLRNNYMYRCAFDYLVKHLLGEEPPMEYDLDSIATGVK